MSLREIRYRLSDLAPAVAHRLSQADLCDRVVVMARGRVVETGPPGVLKLDGSSAYAEMRRVWNSSDDGRR